MNRRDVLSLCVLAAFGPKAVAAYSAPSTHFYSWEWVDDLSTDPEWTFRRPVCITCDGQRCRHVLACLTGPNGFVLKCHLTPDGKPHVNETGDAVAREILRGKVELTYLD